MRSTPAQFLIWLILIAGLAGCGSLVPAADTANKKIAVFETVLLNTQTAALNLSNAGQLSDADERKLDQVFSDIHAQKIPVYAAVRASAGAGDPATADAWLKMLESLLDEAKQVVLRAQDLPSLDGAP